MNDICKAILHIVFAILCALLAGQVETEMFWVVWLALASVCNVWRAIELFMGGGYVLRALKCDNCGEFYDYSVLAITKIAWSRPDGSKFREKDICPECLAAVSKALEDVKMRKRDNPLEDDLK